MKPEDLPHLLGTVGSESQSHPQTRHCVYEPVRSQGSWWSGVRYKAGRGQDGKVTVAVAGNFGRDPRSLKGQQLLGGSAALAESLGRNRKGA